MIAFILFLVHGAVILSIQEEWKDRGLTDTSFRVLGLLLLASGMGVWGLEPNTWTFEALHVSTKLVSGIAGVVYGVLLYMKTSDLITRYLRHRDPLRSLCQSRHPLRRLLKSIRR